MTGKPQPYTYGNRSPADCILSLPASVIKRRPPLAEGAGTSFATDANIDAALEWLAHVEAGRIEVRQGMSTQLDQLLTPP